MRYEDDNESFLPAAGAFAAGFLRNYRQSWTDS
jgi:hypothetical protein